MTPKGLTSALMGSGTRGSPSLNHGLGFHLPSWSFVPVLLQDLGPSRRNDGVDARTRVLRSNARYVFQSPWSSTRCQRLLLQLRLVDGGTVLDRFRVVGPVPRDKNRGGGGSVTV